MASHLQPDAPAPHSFPLLLSVRQQATEMLRIAIFEGELLPGQRLTERQICERVGVSRTIAREAVRELEAERLIESNRRHGFVVTRMSAKDIADLYEVRIVLEAEACRLCAQSVTTERAARLDRSMEAVAAAARSGDAQAQRVSNARFYEAIFEAADNAVLGQILGALHGRISFLRSRSMSFPGRPAASLRELQALLAALKAGDGDAAARLSTAHIKAARCIALQVIAAETGDRRPC